MLNPLFLSLFSGAAAGGAVLIVTALFDLGETEAILRLIGGALYLIGTFAVTGTLNVPRNNVLAAVDTGEPRRRGCLEGLCVQLDRLELRAERWPLSPPRRLLTISRSLVEIDVRKVLHRFWASVLKPGS